MKIAKIIFTWCAVTIITLITTSTLTLLLPLYFYNNYKNTLAHKIATLWAKTIMLILPSVNYEIIGKENLLIEKKSVIYVANHKSQGDILAMLLLGVPFRWIAKKSLFKIPIFGWALTSLGYVAVDRTNKSSAAASLKKSHAYLFNGISMFFFPEGTRSLDGNIQKFKNGAFALAKNAQVPIVPITIIGTETLLQKGSIIIRPANIKIVVHPSIYSDNLSIEELKNAAFNAIKGQL